jgi:hypothetical protein
MLGRSFGPRRPKFIFVSSMSFFLFKNNLFPFLLKICSVSLTIDKGRRTVLYASPSKFFFVCSNRNDRSTYMARIRNYQNAGPIGKAE